MHPGPVSGNYATWISRPGFDCVESSYIEGYGAYSLHKPLNAEIITDVVHTRMILFVKPDYWVLIDNLRSAGNHDYEMLFHASPEITVNLQDKNIVEFAAPGTGARLCLLPEEPSEWNISTLEGCESPIQGWYSVDHHKKAPATTVIFSRHGIGTLTWTTLLYPFSADQNTGDTSIKRLQVSGGKCQAFAVCTPRGVDYLMVSNDNQKKQFGPFQSDENITVVRTDKNGEIINRCGDVFEGCR
jgi:hypothetical protein